MKASAVGRLFRVLGVLLLCLLVTACGNKKITKTNLDKIKTGMTSQEVEAILGPGEDISAELDISEGSSVAGGVGVTGGFQSMTQPRSKFKTLRWESGKKSIQITFDLQGKVQAIRPEGF